MRNSIVGVVGIISRGRGRGFYYDPCDMMMEVEDQKKIEGDERTIEVHN